MDYTMTTDPDIERKVWLVRNRGLLAALSSKLKVSQSMIYKVLQGKRRSARVAQALAEAGAPGVEVSHEHAARKRPKKKSAKARNC
jgi:hypothetical protein